MRVDGKFYFYSDTEDVLADVAGELKVEVGRRRGTELLPVGLADRQADGRVWTGIPVHDEEGRRF